MVPPNSWRSPKRVELLVFWLGLSVKKHKENLCKCLFKERCRHCWSKKGLHIFCLDWGDSHKDWLSQRLIKGWLRRREVWSHCQGDWEVYQKADLILTASKRLRLISWYYLRSSGGCCLRTTPPSPTSTKTLSHFSATAGAHTEFSFLCNLFQILLMRTFLSNIPQKSHLNPHRWEIAPLVCRNSISSTKQLNIRDNCILDLLPIDPDLFYVSIIWEKDELVNDVLCWFVSKQSRVLVA